MVKLELRHFWQIVNLLDHIREKDAEDLRDRLSGLRKQCAHLGLAVSVHHIDDIQSLYPPKGVLLTGDDKSLIAEEASRLAHAIRRELQTKLFLAITDEASIALFEHPCPFDKKDEVSVNERFPDAVYDIQEAANCAALSRPNACVFHLMRVLEVGLMRLAEDLDVRWNFHEWQNVIDRIRQKIGEIEHGNLVKTGDAKADKRYYAGLATQFEHFKDAWRNHAIHVHGVFYDEAKAQIVYLSVREFMRELAKRFSSVPV